MDIMTKVILALIAAGLWANVAWQALSPHPVVAAINRPEEVRIVDPVKFTGSGRAIPVYVVGEQKR